MSTLVGPGSGSQVRPGNDASRRQESAPTIRTRQHRVEPPRSPPPGPATRNDGWIAEARDRIAAGVDYLDAAAQGTVAAAARIVGLRSAAARHAQEGVRLLHRSPVGVENHARHSLETLTEARTARRVGGAARVADIAGRIAAPLAAGLAALDIGLAVRRDGGFGEHSERAVGRVAGAVSGAWIGAAVGTALIPVPGVGTAVGGLVGGFVGSYAGESLAAPVADGIRAAGAAATDAARGAANLASSAADSASGFVGGLFD